MNNKYVNRSKISEAKFRQIAKLFSLDLTANQISEITGLNRNTINRYLNGIRQRISEYCEMSNPAVTLNSEKPGETMKEDHSVIALTERDSKVFISEITKKHLQLILDYASNEERKLPSNPGYIKNIDVLFDLRSEWHLSLRQLKNESGSTYMKKYNRIEGFTGFIKSRLSKFRGLHQSTLYYHLKECEFRYNYKEQDLYTLLLKIIRKRPLFSS